MAELGDGSQRRALMLIVLALVASCAKGGDDTPADAMAQAGTGGGPMAGSGGTGTAGDGFESSVQPFIDKACNCHQSTPVLMAPFSLKPGEAYPTWSTARDAAADAWRWSSPAPSGQLPLAQGQRHAAQVGGTGRSCRRPSRSTRRKSSSSAGSRPALRPELPHPATSQREAAGRVDRAAEVLLDPAGAGSTGRRSCTSPGSPLAAGHHDRGTLFW